MIRNWHYFKTITIVLLLSNCTPTALHTASLPNSEPQPTPAQQLVAEAQTIFHSPADLVLGNPSGKITIVEFFDYNCGYCKANFAQVAHLIETEPDVRFVIKEYPILGEGSVYAARAALAADKQGKYRELHLRLAQLRTSINANKVVKEAEEAGLNIDQLKRDMTNPAIEEVIERNRALAKTLAIRGTPTFIVDTSIEPRFLSYESLKQKVADIRDNGGCQLC